MNCAESRNYLECYVDGELDPITTTNVEKHLENCASCSRAAERLTSLRVLIKEALPYRRTPDHLARKIAARIDAHDGSPRRSAFPFWQWLRPIALVAATALVTWLATMHYVESPRTLLAQDVITSHARATLTGHVADVESSERHTVKPWLSSKLDFSPPVKDLAGIGFPLVGGRVDYVNGRSAAVLVYKRRKHVIDLFVWPESAKSSAVSETLSKNGYQTMHWTDNGMSFWAVSDLNAAELKQFSENFVQAK